MTGREDEGSAFAGRFGILPLLPFGASGAVALPLPCSFVVPPLSGYVVSERWLFNCPGGFERTCVVVSARRVFPALEMVGEMVTGTWLTNVAPYRPCSHSPHRAARSTTQLTITLIIVSSDQL